MRNSFFLKLLLATLFCAPLAAMAQVTIGSLEAPETAALLDFKTQVPNGNNATTDKGGLLLPRVELVDPFSLEPFIVNATADEKLSHIGLTVYNVTHDEPAGLEAGHYYWNGVLWMKMVTSIPAGSVNLRNLLVDVTSKYVAGGGADDGNLMDFGTIIIPEDGSYAFSFRLYGPINGVTSAGQMLNAYMRVYVDGVMADAAELVLYSATSSASSVYTATLTLAASASAGQAITFKFANFTNNNPRTWTLRMGSTSTTAARTSMVWWKL